MSRWQLRPVPFRFQLSDWTLFSVSLPLQVRSERPFDFVPMDPWKLPAEKIVEGSQGFLIRGMPVSAPLPTIGAIEGYVRYTPLQYKHCYIDLGVTFDGYQKQFSSKTRSTINRKIKKFTEHCGGSLVWKTYKSPGEMREFFRQARIVSKRTYQERLLDAGIPDSEDFIVQAESLAADQRIRAYILFNDERPVSYLYCPVHDGVLVYSYLGYDPDYLKLSVGTVLQWLAIEQLFSEARFRYFDFTEGQSDHKRLFATHEQQCANVFFVRRTISNVVLIYCHRFMDDSSKWLGATLDRLGVKAKIKRLLRFGRQ